MEVVGGREGEGGRGREVEGDRREVEGMVSLPVTPSKPQYVAMS